MIATKFCAWQYSYVVICMWKSITIWSPKNELHQNEISAKRHKFLSRRPLTISKLHVFKNRIFHCMAKIVFMESQRYSLKFHIKYLTHILKDVYSIEMWNFRSSKCFWNSLLGQDREGLWTGDTQTLGGTEQLNKGYCQTIWFMWWSRNHAMLNIVS